MIYILFDRPGRLIIYHLACGDITHPLMQNLEIVG